MDTEIEKRRDWVFTITDLLAHETYENRSRFLEWHDKANKIIHGEFNKSFVEKMRFVNNASVDNKEMEFLTDLSESTKPWEIVKVKEGEILQYNITPNLETLDPKHVSEDDIATLNTFFTSLLNKSNFTDQKSKASQDALVFGTGVVKIEFELKPSNYYKLYDGISIKHIPIKQMIVDDNMNEIEDMAYCGETEIVNGQLFYMKLTQKEKNMFNESLKNGLIMPVDRTRLTGGSYYEPDYCANMYVRSLNEVLASSNKLQHVVVYIKQVNEKLEDEVWCFKFLGGVLYSHEKTNSGIYPYRSTTYYPMNGNFFGTSLVYMLFDDYLVHLRSKNAIETSLIYASNPSYMVDIGDIQLSGEELSVAMQVPGAIIPINSPNQSIRRIERADLVPEMLNALSMSEQGMWSTAGENKFSLGQNSGSITTSAGIADMLQAASKSQQVDVPVIERFNKALLNTILQLLVDNKTPIKQKIKTDKTTKVKILDIGEDVLNNIEVIVKTRVENVSPNNAVQAFIQILQLLPPDNEGVSDELRDTLMKGFLEYLPIDNITKAKLTNETLEVAEAVREAKQKTTKEELVKGAQMLAQLGSQRGEALPVWEYLK